MYVITSYSIHYTKLYEAQKKPGPLLFEAFLRPGIKNMVNEPSYELIDHTADFGIRVFGGSAKNLFQNAAMALMDQLVETVDLLARQEKRITIEGKDWPDLMVSYNFV